MVHPKVIVIAFAIGFMSFIAAPPAAARGEIELPSDAKISMVLSGKIFIDKSGEVQKVKMDRSGRISESIKAFIESGVKSWRFEPDSVTGATGSSPLSMRVRLVGKPLNDGHYHISFNSAHFESQNDKPEDSVSAGNLRPPRYPPEALEKGIQGTVVLLIQVGRDGNVIDTVAQQVNLRVNGTEQELSKARNVLANASVTAARRWKFTPPSSGPDVGRGHWIISVPVDFSMDDRKTPYAAWETYIPGPLSTAPWYDEKNTDIGALDLIPAGTVYMADAAKKGPRLMTSLNP